MQKTNYDLLIEKLDAFIRKYYINKFIRGLLYTVATVVVLFLLVNVLEHFYYFGKGMRKALFATFIGTTLLSFGYWVLLPLLNYFKLGKVISHQQAASIIGGHFGDVKDKLLNVLQLKRQSGVATENDLILASINQKSEDIKLVPFKSAINLGQNKKYLKYALPPLMLLVVLLFAAPSMIKDSTHRLVNNDKNFEREAPFHFRLTNEIPKVIQYDDYEMEVEIEGEVYPEEVFIEMDGYQYRLNKQENNKFSYQFSNVQKDVTFNLFSGNVKSEDFNLDVLLKPNIAGFETKLDYPAYTGRRDETVQNIGDLIIPQGTNISWFFDAKNTSDISLQFSGDKKMVTANRAGEESFQYKRKFMGDKRYKILVSNEEIPNADSISYNLSVIPDLHPTINVKQYEDSTNKKVLFFIGDASDDYGLRSLSFNYRVTDEKGNQGSLQTSKLKKPDANQIQYDYSWYLEDLELKAGDQVSYYFEVYDNDGVNGNKASKTNVMNYNMPSLKELEEEEEKNNDEIKKDLEDSLKESEKLQKDFKKLREKLLQEKDMDWQMKKELEKLMERQKEIEEKIQKAKEAFDKNKENQAENNPPNEEIKEKQEKMDEMFEEVMDDEMKELMEKIQELMEEMNKEEALEKMEEMQQNDEEMEMELDRMLELFKQLEVEHEWQKEIEKLEELAKKQEELSEKTEKEEKPQEELEKEQEEIEEEFEEIKKDIEETKKKNEELETPKELGDQKEEEEQIEEEMEKSKEDLKKKDNKGASKSQKSAGEKMQKMADGMAMEMESGEMEQMEEDMKALRQLLENLVTLSFEQEDLISDVNEVTINTPKYVELAQHQHKLKDDFILIEDSLVALSKRIFEIEAFVTEKISEIKVHMGKSLDKLEERKKREATVDQQITMQNVNDLALMLSETMQQMQEQMGQKMAGSQMCNKPGGSGNSGKKPMDKITKGQKEMSEQMKEMGEQMKQGQKPGSKGFAEMAAKQAALRKALREKQKELQEQGKGAKELEDIIDSMNKIETDLVNKRLTNQMMKRQQDILTRLLEAEKAERQREKDNKRKSKTADNKERKFPPSLEEYIKKRKAEIDEYKSVSPSLKPYYKILVEEYYKSLKKS